MTELVPAGLSGVIARKDATVGEALAAARQAEAPALPTGVERPLPGSARLTDEQAKTLRKLVKLLDGVETPESARQLVGDETRELTEALIALKSVKAALDGSEKSLKTAFFNHFDAVAAERGLDTLDVARTKEGWLVSEDKDSAAVDGLGQKAVRETRTSAPELTAEAVEALRAEGEIDHDDYLALTRQTRVLDEDGAMEWIRANPDKAHLLAEASTQKAPTASLYLRKNQ